MTNLTTNQQQLMKQVMAKNRLSSILLCCKILFDVTPQLLLIYMVGLYFASSLSVRQVYIQCSIILLCFTGKALCSYASTWKAHQSAYSCMNDLRIQLIRHLKKLPMGFFQQRKTADLTNIMQHDAEQVEIHLAHGLPETMSATLLPAVVFFIMLWVDWRLALIMIVGLPLMWLTKTICAPLWTKNFRIFSDSVTRMQENVMEYIACISVIKAFAKQETKTQSTMQSAKDYDYWVKKAMGGISIPMGLITLFMESGVVAVMMLGTYLLSIGQISVTRLILSIILSALFTSSIAKTATLHHYHIIFNQAMERIGSVLHVAPANRPDSGDTANNGDIEIRDLDFSYNGKDKVLNNIHLRFPKGSKSALVGASGCGKTTIANLLTGFWKPTAGNITIGAKSTEQLSEKALNRLFSTVQQDVFLFNLSIEENIRIGKPNATMQQIVAAAKRARIHEFIMSLPNGYQTCAGETGVKLSGGEKQRIAIARMILKDAPIVILDEATAAVDTENEAHILATMAELSRDKTVITIAHHLNTIQHMDQIIVMEQGRIVDIGKHESLLARCALYRQMINDQNRANLWKIREISI